MNQTIIQSGPALIALVASHLQEAARLKKIPLLVVLGPTASGKTALGIALAECFNGEIVSADSRQIYHDLPIGTAQPSSAEMKEVKHHLIDFIAPDQEFNLAEFQKLARQYIEQIVQRKHLPLLVGGTGLYISAITQNYRLPAGKPDLRLRKRLEKMASEKGKEAVYQILEQLDPQAARSVSPQNLRYVIRAIEIAGQAGDKTPKQEKFSLYHCLYLTIDWPRDLLYRRIEQRIDRQLAAGLIDETKYLLEHYNENLPALSSLGYREIGQYLHGKMGLEESVKLFKKNTRNYAKRQLTWFRKFTQVYSISGTDLNQIIQEVERQK